MKEYNQPQLDIVTLSVSDDICEGSFAGNSSDVQGTIPQSWDYGD